MIINHCKRCGASRDYIVEQENKVTCSLCGNTWNSFPTYARLMELERQKAELLTVAIKKHRKRGIDYAREQVKKNAAS